MILTTRLVPLVWQLDTEAVANFEGEKWMTENWNEKMMLKGRKLNLYLSQAKHKQTLIFTFKDEEFN